MRASVLFLFLFIISAVFIQGARGVVEKTGKELKEAIVPSTKVSTSFLENKGQMVSINEKPVPFVLFKAEAPGMNLYITQKGITYMFLKVEKEDEHDFDKDENAEEETLNYEWKRMDMELVGASIKKENVVAEDFSETDFNFFLAHCPDGIRGVKEYKKITIKEVYNGIDWVLYKNEGGEMKYDFVVHPGAEAGQIRLRYIGDGEVKQLGNNQLQVKNKFGTLTEGKLFCYRQSDQKEISSNYILTKSSSSITDDYNHTIILKEKFACTDVSIHIADYSNTNETLVIDPQLWWATFVGGNGLDGHTAVTTDAAGNVFTTGYISSTNFPTLNPGGGAFFQGTLGAPLFDDILIEKFSGTGALLWATYYGGTNHELAYSIASDATGNVFISGYTSSTNFPTFNPGGGAYSQAFGGGPQSDIFILKFDNNGVRLWATYYGGSAGDFGWSVATDASGNLFLTGYSVSTNFPVLNPGGGAYFQAASAGAQDAVILKFSNTGVRIWATFIGGTVGDQGLSITADATGNIYTTGYATSVNFPLLNPGGGAYFQNAIAGGRDIFIEKFSNAGVQLWGTYFGGSSDERAFSLITDASGSLFVTGWTQSTDFPTQNPGGGAYFQVASGGGYDAFIIKFTNTGALFWSTYYGGSGNEENLSGGTFTYDNLAINNCGHVFMSCPTASTNIPLQAPPACGANYFDNSYNGGIFDVALTMFTNTGALLWATYVGGDGNDFREPLATDLNNNLILAGEWTQVTNSATYPITDPGGGAYYDSTFEVGSNDDAFIMKFIPILSETSSFLNPTCTCVGSAVLNVTCGWAPFNYAWSTGAQTLNTASLSDSIINLCSGNYWVEVTDAMCSRDTIYFTLVGTSMSTTLAQTNATCNALCNGTAAVTPAGGTPPFSYLWSNSQTTQSISGLCAGTYTVLITDSNNCTVIDTFIISEPAAIQPNISATPSNCNATTGTATVIVSGGTPAYTYLWNDGQTTSTATGLGAGTYTVTITDAGGCTLTATVIVTNPNAPSVSLQSQQNVLCNGGNTGSATVNVSGGTSPYIYIWSPSGGTGAAANNLASGTYTVTITDANGCTQTQTVSITEPAALNISLTGIDANCQPDGQADAIISGGVPGYTYLWNDGQTSSTATGLSPGVYTVTATDANNCTITASTTISGNSISVTISNDTTILVGASAQLNASGGTTYVWSPSTGLDCTSCPNPNATPSQTTTYCVIISDTSGCSDTACVKVFVEFPCGEIFVPSAFSPDGMGDPRNELECVYGNCISKLYFAIFDRWGEKIFETTDLKHCWDGNYKGEKMNTGVYAYFLKATLSTGEDVEKKGNVSLIR